MPLFFSKNKLTKAVILCSSHDGMASPLTRLHPTHMLPVLNRPLIEHAVEFLRARGIDNVVVSTPPGEDTCDIVGRLKDRFSDITLECRLEEKPFGTAGALRELSGFVGDDTFLVVESSLFMSNFDFTAMLAAHTEKGSALTIAVKKDVVHPAEGLSVDPSGEVKSFSIIHPSRERRSPYSAQGIYLFDPKALTHVAKAGYFDIKEQLIPALKQAGLGVHVHEIDGYCKAVKGVDSYFEVHKEILFTGSFEKERMTEVADEVWIGRNTVVSQSAYIAGPVLIGDDCVIGDNVQILGPAVIGDRCTIKSRARVREAICFNDVEADEDSSISYSIVEEGQHIGEGDGFEGRIVINTLGKDSSLHPSKYEFISVGKSLSYRMGGLKYSAYLLLKRLTDILVSGTLLVLLSPLLLAIAILVKTDSKGPATFRQRRCGKDGFDFEMYKFRTMVQNAHALQQKLRPKNNADGPMFKLADDPRVTRVGKVLRRTSLDEFLQLVNVFKGEMSLVGPRPLVMEEMKFCPSWRNIRLKVKPGITGLWQVEGRSEAPFHDWIRYDLHYVKNQSLLLDFIILLRTFKVVFKRVGAY